ncbi:MAG: TAT-variant-translocated molybdopterin oxidoreductase [Bacteroidota bacterium]
MNSTKKYWKGLEQLENSPEFVERANKEFPEELPLEGAGADEPSRRDFLKMMGFGLGAVSLAACEAPVKNAIPWAVKPEEIDPSIPNFYASTYVSGSDVCSIVVKTKDGRPIKVEGNQMCSFIGGGTSPEVDASVLSLYDKERLTGPKIEGAEANWEAIDQAVGALPATAKVALVSNTISSPTTLSAIEVFKQKFESAAHIVYDQCSAHGVLEANARTWGKRAFPSYDFSKAKTIVSIGGDFLRNGVNKVVSDKQFASTRKLTGGKKDMSRLYVFESNYTLTGANADYRVRIKASEEEVYVKALYDGIVLGRSAENEILQKAIGDLKTAASQQGALVLAGANDADVQVTVNAINEALGSYGSTINVDQSMNLRQGDDLVFDRFVTDLSGGSYDAVFFYNCNPVYDHPKGAAIAEGLKNVAFTLSTSDRMDETSSVVKYVAPDHHYLESWNDFEVMDGYFTLSQPTISNIFDTRQAQESFMKWGGTASNYYEYLRSRWEEDVMPLSGEEYVSFDYFWDKSLHDGFFIAKAGGETREDLSFNGESVAQAVSSLSTSGGDGLELILYQKNSVGMGAQANNPWLQEMPDPITKACWDNYITASPKQVEAWGVKTDTGRMSTQLVNLTVGGQTIKAPVLPQPGQAEGTIGLALGYGRTKAGKVANGVGVNAFPLIQVTGKGLTYSITEGVSVDPTSEIYQIAQMQTSQTYMGRETVIQETVSKAYQEDPQAGRHFPKIATAEGFKKPQAVSLWKGHEYANHHWGLAIDLNSCTGCGTCVVACQSENNIPVVGKQEVINRREMHWLRIDRYYSTDAPEDDLVAMEKAAENPEVVFQPMMCQQCNNAPCETVCPVAATTHSSEGLNQMTYNRCIGTRYCANNCPYKVRRFNWFKYHDNDQFATNTAMNNDLGKMVLNPDVTVRARGVMEKCTFCVQRIQAGKLKAKLAKRRPIEEDITSACGASCPTEAMVFGDMKDPNSKISKLLKIKSMKTGVEAEEPRAYHVLEELRVMPNVWYLTKVRNKDEDEAATAYRSGTHQEEPNA